MSRSPPRFLAVLVWWAVGRALRPVEGIRTQVDRITGSRLDERVPEPATAEEIARLARTMNAMLDRLQRSAEEQRRFVGDASHELRGPLARMRAELEVDAAHPGSADPAATSASTLAEVEALERAVRNLLDNAVRRARDSVVLALGEQPAGTAVLTVADDGPGIPPADADRVFERFTRLDDSRSAGDVGAGLGLAIARDVAKGHGGSLVLDPAVARGARFVLRLPVARTGGASV